ncbi:hypothetical protein LZ30DRAFT_693943 [Colletotrichum cereale]|nr:hypothetical protein LZ30DRAFT_693943 [Colletotrichum cereale]
MVILSLEFRYSAAYCLEEMVEILGGEQRHLSTLSLNLHLEEGTQPTRQYTLQNYGADESEAAEVFGDYLAEIIHPFYVGNSLALQLGGDEDWATVFFEEPTKEDQAEHRTVIRPLQWNKRASHPQAGQLATCSRGATEAVCDGNWLTFKWKTTKSANTRDGHERNRPGFIVAKTSQASQLQSADKPSSGRDEVLSQRNATFRPDRLVISQNDLQHHPGSNINIMSPMDL